MRTYTRGRLSHGHRMIVGGMSPRRSVTANVFIQLIVPLMLVSGLGLLIADHAGTLILSFQKAAAPRAIEWVELESSYSNPNSFDPHDIQAVGLPGFAPEVRRWSASIERWSKSYELPPLLIAIVMQIESCGDAHAQSSAGARGLFQVMPFHFESGENSYEPETNARRGLAYLRGAYDIGGGKIDLALAGYNGGHTQIGRDPSHWPEETRRYVVWGTGIWEDLVNGASSSPTLAAWLDAGGARLCQSALASVDDR